ncbi:translation initiation factor IF-3 [Candidatus Saccharibacteria bacterium]|nr:translation initiation factor IF-3 [Candidatus Saccharibacteria bacterium]
MKNRIRLNHEIKAPTVRLLGVDSKQIGVMSLKQALEQAESQGYDLAEVSPAAEPPVAKLIDWGKYQYEQAKHEAKSRKKQKTIEVKQVRMGLKIGDHDIEVKRRAARKFLEAGNKVKITARFKGREMTHQDLGKQVLIKFFEGLSDIASIEQEASMTGRDMSIVVGQSKAYKSKKINEKSNAQTQDQQDDE